MVSPEEKEATGVRTDRRQDRPGDENLSGPPGPVGTTGVDRSTRNPSRKGLPRSGSHHRDRAESEEEGPSRRRHGEQDTEGHHRLPIDRTETDGVGEGERDRGRKMETETENRRVE